MHYQNVRAAKFIDRPNRFIAHVELDGSVETVHVKNTGRCRELLVPGTAGAGLHGLSGKGNESQPKNRIRSDCGGKGKQPYQYGRAGSQ